MSLRTQGRGVQGLSSLLGRHIDRDLVWFVCACVCAHYYKNEMKTKHYNKTIRAQLFKASLS